jgi:hypothetical protein
MIDLALPAGVERQAIYPSPGSTLRGLDRLPLQLTP